MIQLLPHVQTHVTYAHSPTHYPVLGNAFGDDFMEHRTPMPWAVTLRNLVIYSGDSSRTGDITQTLQKNATDTALEATLPAAQNGPILTSGIDVSFAQFDDCRFKTVNTVGGVANPGHVVAWCVELESQGNVFGIGADQFGSCVVGNGGIGGALGNGFWQSYTPGAFPNGGARSTTYSICSTPGNLTHLVLRTYDTAPAIGDGWIARIRLNAVIQDGTGGTVNTTCTLTGNGATTTAAATFTLPLVPGDYVEVVYIRTGTNLAFTLGNHIGVGVGFVPATAGAFMLTGGSNQALTAPGFVWPFSEQNETDELLAQAPVGPGGFLARGLYIEAPAPGSDPDDEVTRWLRKSGVSTQIAVVMQHLETSGLITGMNVRYSQGDFISIIQLATGGSSPIASSLHWGLVFAPLSAAGGTIGPLAWVHWPRRIP